MANAARKVKSFRNSLLGGLGLTLAGLVCTIPAAKASPSAWVFDVVVNNSDTIPSTGSLFNAYNQPSISNDGLVVFRARGRGGSGQPATGIFMRQLETAFLPQGLIQPVALRGGLLPQPGNNQAATFIEFPSFPRMEATSPLLAFRAQSTPSWKVLPDGESLGTSAIFSNPAGSLANTANQLGAVSGFSYFAVPGTVPGTTLRFDQFPGAPSPTNNQVVFKGNWTTADLTSATGVYVRDMVAQGGQDFVRLIADTSTLIPGTATVFGSTAPPSAAAGRMVFLGVDNEEAPTKGGLYLSELVGPPQLKPIVGIHGLESLVGAGGLTAIGEAVSFNGKSIGYWGAWGQETFLQQVLCPTDGNAALRAYCVEQSPKKDGVYAFTIPKQQGIFVTDVDSLDTRIVAQTNDQWDTFLTWNFSGRPPGMGETDEQESELELARWRSTAFVALDGTGNVAFKAQELAPVDLVSELLRQSKDGIYTAANLPGATLQTLLETGMDGALVDPQAENMVVTSVGLERDGYRGGRVAFVASMANGTETWAGVYVATPGPLPVLGVGAAFRFSRKLKARLRTASR